MTHYGIPYFLEDKSGRLSGGEFVDLHDRLRLDYRCTARDSTHTAYMIYKTNPQSYQSSVPTALIALDFGPHNTLGTVSFSPHLSIPMKKYLYKGSSGSKSRKFIASDGQEYLWSWRIQDNQEWTCTNGSGYLVAYYSLKLPSEPHYEGSSGCTLTIDESFGHLAHEMLATLMIMRHIVQYRL
ncbi:hypothetical protein C8J56DRAFT_920548 [Mycena floridula]|nr:hypothetical protein C8J56DRAFT_920548 [Mycena floridula]